MAVKKIKVQGENLIETLKGILRKGNATRILIKDESDKVILNVPVTLVATGALLAPVLAGIFFGLALIKEYTIEIESK